MRKIIAGTAVATVLIGSLALPQEPKGALNPQVKQETVNETICVPNWTKTIRPPTSYTNKLKKQQLGDDVDYGLFEYDHFIPLSIGGAPTSTDNLWPQLYFGPNNARQKDVVENYLHRQVCKKNITLKEAQQKIYEWKDIYKKLKQ